MTPRKHTETRHGSTGPKVVRCSSAADFLGSLPIMLGYEVSNSLVVALFEGNRTSSAMRFDLPASDTPLHAPGLSHALEGFLQKLPGVTRIALVIYTDESFSEHEGIPRKFLARQLERTLTRNGYRIEELCCVATDGWASYFDDAPVHVPRQLHEIRESTASLEAALLIDSPLKRLTDLGALPSTNDDLAARIGTAIAGQGLTNAPIEVIAQAMGAVLRDGIGDANIEYSAEVVVSARDQRSWLVLLTVLMIGAEATVTLFQELGHVDTIGAQSVRALINMFSTQHLDHEDLSHSIDVVATLVAHSPEPDRPGLFALQSWLWWMSAVLSPAHAQISAALSIDPSNTLAVMMRDVIDGGPPAWVFTGHDS